jgi:hypothetical protein
MLVKIRGGRRYKGQDGGTEIDIDESVYAGLSHLFDVVKKVEPKKVEPIKQPEIVEEKVEPLSEMVELPAKDRMMMSPTSADKRRRK